MGMKRPPRLPAQVGDRRIQRGGRNRDQELGGRYLREVIPAQSEGRAMTERTVCMSGALPRKPGSGCYRGPPGRPQGPAVLRMPSKAKRSPGGRAVPGTGCEDRPRTGAHGRPFLQGPLLQAPRRDGPGPCPRGQPQSSLAGAPETTQQNVCREGEGGRAVFARISNAWLKGDKNPTFQRRGKEGVWRAGEQAHILCGELAWGDGAIRPEGVSWALMPTVPPR